jgi:hypothetical protein
MCEDRVAIGVDEVRGAERAELAREPHHRGEPVVEAREPVFPERREPIAQRAEGVLRIRVPDTTKAARREAQIGFDAGQHAVVDVTMDTTAELAGEGLRIAYAFVGPASRDGCAQARWRYERRGSVGTTPAALARRLWLAHDERVAVLHEADAPPVAVRAGLASVTRQLPEGQMSCRRESRRHREKLTHRSLRLGSCRSEPSGIEQGSRPPDELASKNA